MLKKKLARIIGLGSYLPERILSNQDLEKMVETSDEWIVSRTGMKERRIASAEEASSDLAIKAAKKALDDASIDPKDIDLIIVATSTPDHLMPSTASLVQKGIGSTNAAAFDIAAACTGYLYGLSVAKAYIESGMCQRVLLIASEKMSAFIDYQDRNTCVLFGDGASAAVISNEGAGFIINEVSLGAAGELADLIMIPAGGSRLPVSEKVLAEKKQYFCMQGKEVFKHAVRKMSASVKECLDKAGIEESKISWLIPHQANERIIDAISKNFHFSETQVGKTVQKYGNMSASSVAVTFEEVVHTHTIKAGEHILLVAFGAGLTWGACLLTRENA